ncbi:ribosome maturation factor RimP [Portibacter lacus]|uniref:Ribosome maturation factor RimP n=1 Tax=Portibacter lacus TaxID=1099794 RepID=A0AA37SSX4_9BACT|nr:ribosome maturation factor [Portibacter lacus]GLR18964.1 ribosome maturation factor RimP [Portibacter lacus]
MKEEQIIQLLEAYFQESELEDCFVTELSVSGSKILVFVDSDSDMGFNKCRKISRFLESHFDETQVFGEKYLLEVSSPGIGKPLKFKRQYIKNIGRTVEVTLKEDGKKVKGLLKDANEEGVELEYEVKEKQGKKNIKKTILHPIKDEEIEKIIVKVSF